MLRSVQPDRESDNTGFESTRYLTRWLVLGALIGVVAGLGAVLFIRAIGFATDLFLGGLAGYLPPRPFGEGKPCVGRDRAAAGYCRS